MRRPYRERVAVMPEVPKPLPLAAPEGMEAAQDPLIIASPNFMEGGGQKVTVSIPLVVVLGAFVWLAWRYMGLRTWQAVLCLLLGFLLAATSSAPVIRHAVTQIVRAL